MEHEALVARFLHFLSVEKQPISLAFLNELIQRHQERVRWETLTKILDWEKGNRTGNYLPSIDTYIERIVNKGMGGTCWTNAIGFHWLLSRLGFSVSYMYMNPGHLCLRVDLDQPYYVDVGYCAPLFQAYPLYQSFQVKNVREVFTYQVSQNEIQIIRNPGPTKTLDPNPIALEKMTPLIRNANNWDTSPMLQNIQIFGYINGIPTSLNDNVLKQYFQHEKVERHLNPDELREWVTEKFQIDQQMYENALSIFNEKKT